jgi:hypothetical protein
MVRCWRRSGLSSSTVVVERLVRARRHMLQGEEVSVRVSEMPFSASAAEGSNP